MSNRRTEAAITQIADQAGLFSLNCTDVAGAVSEVSALMSAQAEAVAHLRDATATLDERRGDVGVATRSIESSLQEITATSDRSAQSVGLVADNIRELADAVAGLEERIGALSSALETVAQVSTVINGIARQTNLLALNATIEAARAGEAGRGFTVVASEVKKLSGETSSATEQIQEVLERLSSQTEGLIGNIRESSGMAQNAQTQVTELIQSFEDMQRVTNAATECNEQIGHASEAMADACQRVDEQLTRVTDGSTIADRKLKESDGRLSDLVAFSEKLIHITATTDVETADTHYIRLAQENAARIEALFEEALKKGEITLDALFDAHYAPVPGSNPAQVTTKFTALTDRLLPGLQDALLTDERIVFCAAVDRNGYLPTHNSKFSKPQRAGDPAWNAANCRNRRLFNDRVGLRAGQNEEEFALQTYRRDMGGGVFVMMKDVSAPITVRGRHWGGFRMGVKAE